MIILIILEIVRFVLIRGFFFFHGAIGKGMNQQIHSKKKKEKRRRYLLFLCLLGQFVNIFGGRPNVYILGYI